MTNKFILYALFFISSFSFSQDYMDDIVSKACECINNISDKKVQEGSFEMELGLCIIKAATPYEKQLKRNYKIDLANIDVDGEELGRVIGLKMVTVCPDGLMKMSSNMEQDDSETWTESVLNGTIINIDETKFIEFSVKDTSGKISKFYWFTFVESNVELSQEYKNLLKKEVQITFLTQEFFDPRINEYHLFNIITKLEVKD